MVFVGDQIQSLPIRGSPEMHKVNFMTACKTKSKTKMLSVWAGFPDIFSN